MSTSSSDLRSKLAKAKGLGAAHHGFSHWWLQRLTAVALIPLSVWFVYELLTVVLQMGPHFVRGWFTQPLNASLLVLMLIAMFWHAKLGLQVVIEDYVHQPAQKYALLLANNFFCFACGVISVLAVMKIHFGLIG
ncbi:MAG: succinate dehydrogenase, hydrophobic membrane anchor protein [Rickettsiales bacterium]